MVVDCSRAGAALAGGGSNEDVHFKWESSLGVPPLGCVA